MSSLEELSWKELSDRLQSLQRAGKLSGEFDVARLVHELQVHQLELEMQNRELRETRETLEASRAKYADLYDRAPVGYATLDARGKIEEINLTAAGLLRREREQLIGAPFAAVAESHNSAVLFELLRAATQGVQGAAIDIARDERGHPTSIEVTATALRKQQKTSGFQVTLVDVTQKRRAEVERAALDHERRARAQADAANHMKDEFLGIVSHELRTPLNAMLGWMQILETRASEPDVVQRGLEVMRRNGQSLARLVDDVLDVSRIVSGKLQVDLARLVVDDVVRSAVDQARPMARAKRVELTEAIAAGCEMRGDRVRLHQAVSNLLVNAIKFTGEGGHVEVTLGRDHGVLRLTVRDDGCGIAAVDLPHVFERFRQADSSTTRAHSGLGLGLAIARYIVEAHGGTIEARSSGTGRGATFLVTLPAGLEGGPPSSARWGSSRPPTGPVAIAGTKVLCVDNDEDAVELMELMLKGLGASVRIATSVDEAMVALESFRPDLVLSDVAMPAADGYDLIRRLRGMHSPVRETLAVALTAYARAEDAARARSAGFDDHLGKPVDAEKLAEVVAKLLLRRRLRTH